VKPPRRKRGLNWAGLVGILTTVAGIIQLPEVTMLLNAPQLVSPHVAVGITAVGAVIQSLTRPVRRERERRSDKEGQ
jgi:hypothetical protein